MTTAAIPTPSAYLIERAAADLFFAAELGQAPDPRYAKVRAWMSQQDALSRLEDRAATQAQVEHRPVISEFYTFKNGQSVFSGWTWSLPGSKVSHGPFKTYAAAQIDIARKVRA
ncbi:MAG: hypothetical protein CVV27_10615 [Candidatus Melainabacteria bacterium HGW-Melainabacteria-1]|nr:MAG: hypothetical protein CVV27_10615 [Candidatus Melainabacteria bacterium HGW-Melainabacteria-1]